MTAAEAVMWSAVKLMERTRDAMARPPVERVVYACSTCGRLAAGVFCCPRCEADYRAYAAQQEGQP